MEKTLGFLGNQFVLVNFFYHKTKLGWTVQIQTVILVDYPTLLLVLTQMWHPQCWLFLFWKVEIQTFLLFHQHPVFIRSTLSNWDFKHLLTQMNTIRSQTWLEKPSFTSWWYTYPSEKWWSSSIGMMKFPIICWCLRKESHGPSMSIDVHRLTLSDASSESVSPVLLAALGYLDAAGEPFVMPNRGLPSSPTWAWQSVSVRCFPIHFCWVPWVYHHI